MKKIVFILCILLFSFPLFAKDENFYLQFGFDPSLRYLYNDQFSPGMGSLGFLSTFRYKTEYIFIESGFNLAISGLGLQMTFPVSIGKELYHEGIFSIDLLISALPGFAFFRPAPLFIIGAGIENGYSFRINKDFGIRLFLGLRFSTCPEYSAKIYPYWIMEMPFGLSFTSSF